MYSKVSKRLGVLRRLKQLLTVYARKLYITIMVIPILEYANVILGDKNNKVFMSSIQLPQNKTAKMILDKAPHLSSTMALYELKSKNLYSRRQMQCCIFVYNLMNDKNQNNLIIRGLDLYNYKTRYSKCKISYELGTTLILEQ